MNILFPFVGDSVGGSHWSVINLFIELKTNKLINPKIVLHIADGPLSKHLDKMGINYDILPLNNLAGQIPSLINISFYMLFNLPLVIKYIKNNNINIVHGNDLRVNLTWSLPVRFSSAKYVWHQRSCLSNSIKWHAIRYISDYVVSISNYVNSTLPANLNKELVECIKNPFDTKTIYDKKESREILNEKYPYLKNVFVLGYVGRLVSWKHVEDILYALQKVVHRINDIGKVHLVIVGEGDINYTDKINHLISSLGLSDHVTMTGFVNNPSLILSAVDLFIASSHNEPFGRVIIESMIQRTPVLASRSGGHIETIDHNKTGLLYDEFSSYELSQYIFRIVSKDINTAYIVDDAYHKAVLDYSIAEHANKMISIYNGLV
ncbi:glycosyltransferase family 4 protein [bacterium]|mgnify:FL=1|nr:glycosyltransferase family 4 protein [bacterium]